MAALSPIVKEKLEYLGRGVDCREGHKKWLSDLEAYAGEPIRRIHEKYRENPVRFFQDTTRGSVQERNAKIGSKIKIEHGFIPINLGTDFLVELHTVKTANDRKKLAKTRTATIPDAIKDESGAIEVPRFKVWCSEFEKNLCTHILSTNEKDFRELFEADYPEQYTCAITTFNGLIELANGKKVSETFWQSVYDACSSFLEKTKYTHYVYSITLGAEQTEADSSKISKRGASGTAEATVHEVGEASSTAQLMTRSEHHTSHVQELGRLEPDGEVSVEEVIAIRVKSIANLINPDSNNQLKAIMHAILESYNPLVADMEYGPYQIFCKEERSSGNQSIYWCVNENEVHGTCEEKEACHFYINIVKTAPLRFYISYITGKDTSAKKMVKIKRPYNPDVPLQLVRHSWHKAELVFTLESQIIDETKIPPTPIIWQRKSPFFLKQPKKLWRPRRAQRYVKMMKKPKYPTATSLTIDDESSDMMLFYFKEVIVLQDNQGTIKAASVGGPSPGSTTKNDDDVYLWRIQEDQGVRANETFYKLVGKDSEILL